MIQITKDQKTPCKRYKAFYGHTVINPDTIKDVKTAMDILALLPNKNKIVANHCHAIIQAYKKSKEV